MRDVDLRLVAPAAVAWILVAVMLPAYRNITAAVGVGALLLGAAVLGLGRRGGRGPVIALALALAGASLMSLGIQGALAEGTPLSRAAQEGQRVTVRLRIDDLPHTFASPWGGEGTTVLEGTAWWVNDPAGGGAGGPADTADASDAAGGSGTATGAGTGRGPPVRVVAWTQGTFRQGQTVVLSGRASPADRQDRARVVMRGAVALGTEEPAGWRGVVYRLKVGLAQECAPLPGDAAGLLPGIAVGDTSGVSRALDQAMKGSSLAHITAVSGAHVAVILGTAMGIAALCRAKRGVRALVGAGVLLGFVALVGPEPSVLRAAVMGAVALVAVVWGRPREAMGALGAAIVVLIVVDPFMARSYGLVLSAAATASLIALAPPLGQLLGRHMPERAAEAIALPLSAQVVCAPILVVFTGKVSLVGVVANILVLPAVPVATVGGLLACLAHPWAPALAALGVWPAGWGAWWIARVATWTVTWPFAVITWPSGAWGAVSLVGAIVIVAAVGRAVARGPRWAKVAVASVAAAGVVLVSPLGRPVVWPLVGRGPPEDWVAAVCDVGQGTAVVARSGTHSGVMVDVGPQDGGVEECLSDLGIDTLDAVVLTHFHADHVGGLEQAIHRRSLGSLIHPLPCGQDGAARHVEALVREAGASSVEVTSADGVVTGTSGAVSLMIFPSSLDKRCPSGGAAGAGAGGGTGGSAAGGAGEDSAANDAGESVFIEVGGLALWCLGDLEAAGQAALVKQIERWADPGGTDNGQRIRFSGGVVVVAHHGSARQAESLAELLDPRIAVMSAGKDNPYGHPNPKAIALYGRAAQVERTDECGTIVLEVVGAEPVASSRC